MNKEAIIESLCQKILVTKGIKPTTVSAAGK